MRLAVSFILLWHRSNKDTFVLHKFLDHQQYLVNKYVSSLNDDARDGFKHTNYKSSSECPIKQRRPWIHRRIFEKILYLKYDDTVTLALSPGGLPERAAFLHQTPQNSHGTLICANFCPQNQFDTFASVWWLASVWRHTCIPMSIVYLSMWTGECARHTNTIRRLAGVLSYAIRDHHQINKCERQFFSISFRSTTPAWNQGWTKRGWHVNSVQFVTIVTTCIFEYLFSTINIVLLN